MSAVFGKRVGDEPMPVRGAQSKPVVENARCVFVATSKAQQAKGEVKYGGPLVTWDERDTGNDAYQELADLAHYLEKLAQERRDMAVWMLRAVEELGCATYTAECAALLREFETMRPTLQRVTSSGL